MLPVAAAPLPTFAVSLPPPSAVSAPAPPVSSFLSPGQPSEMPGTPHPAAASAPGSGFVLPCGQIKSIEGEEQFHKTLGFLFFFPFGFGDNKA